MKGPCIKLWQCLVQEAALLEGKLLLLHTADNLNGLLHLVEGVQCIKDGELGVIVASLGPEVVSIQAVDRMLTVQEMAVVDPGHLTDTGYVEDLDQAGDSREWWQTGLGRNKHFEIKTNTTRPHQIHILCFFRIQFK